MAGFALKDRCSTGQAWDGDQYRRLCYNDVQALYGRRQIDRNTFPYVDGELRDGDLHGGAIEYPVLTGTFMWFAGLFADDFVEYLRVNALLLAPVALATAYLLYALAGARAWLWAAAPSLLLYAFHNWEILSAAALVVAVQRWWRGAPAQSAAWLGIGGALKIYPLLLLPALCLWALQRDGARAAARVAGAGAGAWVAVNLPFALVNPSGWWATYAFHSERTGNFDSIWNLGWPELEAAQLNLLTSALVGVMCLIALGYGWRRRAEGYPWLEVGAACVAAMMLWNKVHSPQYTLWILPFFVLLRVHVGWWIAYALADLAVYVGVFRWFYESVYLSMDETFFKQLMVAGVWGRAVLLLILYAVFLRARSAVTRSPVPS